MSASCNFLIYASVGVKFKTAISKFCRSAFCCKDLTANESRNGFDVTEVTTAVPLTNVNKSEVQLITNVNKNEVQIVVPTSKKSQVKMIGIDSFCCKSVTASLMFCNVLRFFALLVCKFVNRGLSRLILNA